ncbi:pimeloyl-ACP methyl ester carboxylesterase [Thermosporothrix hazakensis]|jgi:pimeloyl-ACP methyl ester carboxylesterase|uniref:Pimeloyl-ACP methyl ester carboxylesterase n=2 Tax=Thermosporothrix TaxID=768650 RepID=A0A326U6S8_THEHA|nr:alpha/beta hydrolase [Thermosporothrix hazakensis]PZW28027.1 pimeloyl-ACP methyl ester carboxylesterase [Thermosporothrix hazakensis]BBH86957.1 alpha/beta hydrolase [Thermosporothrix sp. COM3]GCE51248.1 alpha/beta hydrolase [Thermosporothrix hazakensis]
MYTTGKYANVNGINLYYEIHGTGTPLVLLHGGFGSFEMFSALWPELAHTHQVIGVDLYGMAHTALTERPMQVESMADDIAGLLDHLGIEQASVLGYSLGGKVALQTAFRHPERVRKLVVISTPFKWSAWYPEVRANFASIASLPFENTPMHEAYKQIAPRPEDFPRLRDEMHAAVNRSFDWTEQVKALTIPTLIVAGDSDGFPPSHAVEFFNLLGGGKKDIGINGENRIPSQLAILPGADHYTMLSRSEQLLPLLKPFLAEKQA